MIIVHGGLFPCCSQGAIDPNQYLVLILAPGLWGEQVEVQDFMSNKEIVNPFLAQSCCFVFIKMVLTTATLGVGGWVGGRGETRAGQLLASSDAYAMQPSSLIFQPLLLKHFISSPEKPSAFCFTTSFLFFVFYLLIFSFYFSFPC